PTGASPTRTQRTTSGRENSALRRQRGAAVLHALAHFLDRIGALGHVVFELDRRRDLPLVLLHQLEDLLDRRLSLAPRQVERAVLRRRAVLQVEAGRAV